MTFVTNVPCAHVIQIKKRLFLYRATNYCHARARDNGDKTMGERPKHEAANTDR